MSRQSTIALLRLLACVLVLFAFVPHHHADGDSIKPCPACVSAQNAASSMPADAPAVIAPVDQPVKSAASIVLPVTAAYHAPLVPRAPPV